MTKVMKKISCLVSAVVALASIGSVKAESFTVNWNSRFRTDIPYEIEVNPSKLKADGFAIVADGKELETRQFVGKAEGTVALRFKVPAGTKSLKCETGRGTKTEDSALIDNLFVGQLSASKWKLPSGVICTPIKGGLKFAAEQTGEKLIACEAEVPKELRGRSVPVKVELDFHNASTMTWAEMSEFVQLDATGKELAERLSDKRWTSHMQPAGKFSSYREVGRLHPQANKIRFQVKLYANARSVDEYGMPRKFGKDALPQLEITRLVVRPTAVLPFPGRAADFFTEGVSGEEGDRALRLGAERGFWYQTRGNASWAGSGMQYRDEQDIFFPAGDGTVEAWIKPEWKNLEKTYHIFEGSSHTIKLKPTDVEMFGRKKLFAVTYIPSSGKLGYYRKDMKDREYIGEGVAKIPAGKWTHIACTFAPGGKARVFVDGNQVLEVSLEGYQALDLKKNVLPNNTDVVSAFIGGEAYSVSQDVTPNKDKPIMEGAVDRWRVSTGVRYDKNFTPSKTYTMDEATRAYFDFDDSFDGTSAGGIGWIPGSLRAEKWSIKRTVKIGDRTVQYYPETIIDENNPDKVLNKLNYPRMPSVEEFHSAHKQIKRTFEIDKQGVFAEFKLQNEVYPDYVEIVNRGDSILRYPMVLNRGELDARSFGDMSDSLCAEPLSDRERVNKTFNFLLKSSDYFINDTAVYEPDSPYPENVQYKALMMINGYCGFECGPLNSMSANLFACAAKCPSSMTSGYGHLFQQVFFDGKNHIYDLSAQRFFPWWDNETSAYLEEDANEPGIHNRINSSSSHFIRHGTRIAWVGEPGYRLKTGISLRPGERFVAWFDNAGEVNDLFCSTRVDQWIKQKTRNFFNPEIVTEECCAEKKSANLYRFERFFPQAANGYLIYKGKPSANKSAFIDEGGAFLFRVESGYPITVGDYHARLGNGKDAELDFSFDGKKTWHSLPAGRVEYPVRARLAYWIKVKAPMASVVDFSAKTVIQMNARTFPGRVRKGENQFRFKSIDEGKAEVTIAWREKAKRIVFKDAAYTGIIPGVEKATVLAEPGKPLEVEVEGASAKAVVEASAGLSAKLTAGKLTINCEDAAKAPFVGYVTVIDGAAKKSLTVIECEGAKWVPASAAELSGAAKMLAKDVDRVQPCVMLTKKGDAAKFKFERLPKGQYVVWNVNRFASHINYGGNRVLISVEGAIQRGKTYGASATNLLINYWKAQYGQKGGRGCFKWDVANDPKTFRPYFGTCKFECPRGTDSVTFEPASGVDNGVEIAGVLIMPWSESATFRRDLLKVLGGVNCVPERVKGE